MADAVLYEIGSGRITAVISADITVIEADPRPHLLVDEYRWDYDLTHRVENGKLVQIERAA